MLEIKIKQLLKNLFKASYMERDMIKDKAEYLMALISNFAKNHGLNVFQSYRYVKRYGGIELVDEHYEIMHTLSFAEALDMLVNYLKRQGGKIE